MRASRRRILGPRFAPGYEPLPEALRIEPSFGARTNPRIWVDTDSRLGDAVAHLLDHVVVSLDLETTIDGSRTLCLLQLASYERTYIVDPVGLNLKVLDHILSTSRILKLSHNASFEKSVLAKHGLEIQNHVCTLAMSRRLRGHKIEGGHSLGVVCQRELGIELDKSEAVSDWRRRPLTVGQWRYAAEDVEVLLPLYDHFRRLEEAQQREAEAEALREAQA